jgi:hypothetical protein
MKRGAVLIICLVLLFALFQTSFLTADEITQNLESRIVESFDNPDGQQWLVMGSKFVTEGKPLVAYANAWPEALFGANKAGQDLKVLAINASFDRMGYNFLDIIPVAKDADGNIVPSPIPLPGRVKVLDLWVWGSNYDYYMDLHLRDFTGVVHVLRLGTLKYTGGKNLSAEIPGYIPQSGGYVTAGGYIKNLELVKLVLWTKPTENVSGFNVFIDQIKVLTDTFVSRFDGDELADPEKINEIFSNAVQGGTQ